MARERVDLDDARRVAVAVAQEAGTLLRSRSRGPLGARPKGSSGDVVTDLDLAAEELIVGRLRDAFPGHRIVAEESGVHGADDTWTWLVDPLDGTNNVAIGLPAYAVGIALCADETPVVGVVHDPVSRQTWSAVRAGGAVGPRGALSPPKPSARTPVLAWTQGHGVARADATARALRMVLELHAQRLLQLWAPLLCWVMLARGDIDGFVGYRAEAIDLPAGSLIAAEAGFAIRCLDGSPFDQRTATADRRSFVASHPDRIEALLDIVRTADAIGPAVNALRPVDPAVAR